MSKIFLRLLFLLAGSSGNDLRRQIQFLKAETEIPRSQLNQRIRVTQAGRTRLEELGKPPGQAIRHLFRIVTTDLRAARPRTGSGRGCSRPGAERSGIECGAAAAKVAYHGSLVLHRGGVVTDHASDETRRCAGELESCRSATLTRGGEHFA
jgi:hypothetical protein